MKTFAFFNNKGGAGGKAEFTLNEVCQNLKFIIQRTNN